MTVEVLKSQHDNSVNFVERLENGDVFESRYVRRNDDYFIAYLSSHSGCNKACRMCHLTQTGQVGMNEATIDNYVDQAKKVVDYWKNESGTSKPSRINYNFMARGEPLSNQQLVNNWGQLSRKLYDVNRSVGINDVEFNISTIMPKDFEDYDLFWVISGQHAGQVRLYYSLYSMQERFRKRWLPKALDPNIALDMLADYQHKTDAEIALHWAFIEGENDDLETLEEIVEAVKERDLKTKFNLVRYNPYSPAQGKEPSEQILQRNFDFMRNAFDDEVGRIVPRVGHDVKVSCGMFVDG